MALTKFVKYYNQYFYMRFKILSISNLNNQKLIFMLKCEPIQTQTDFYEIFILILLYMTLNEQSV